MYPTLPQTSAGGVVFRRRGRGVQVALIAVGDDLRWGLPKGLVGRDESPLAAALREVREETGLAAEPVELIDRIEYWYFAARKGGRVRYHKTVHFYLMRARGGSLDDHDHEVREARWWRIDDAIRVAAYAGERKVLERARQLIATVPARRPKKTAG